MKECRNCREVLPDSAFYPCRRHKDGLQSWCKDCSTGAAMRRYYALTGGDPSKYQPRRQDGMMDDAAPKSDREVERVNRGAWALRKSRACALPGCGTLLRYTAIARGEEYCARHDTADKRTAERRSA